MMVNKKNIKKVFGNYISETDIESIVNKPNDLVEEKRIYGYLFQLNNCKGDIENVNLLVGELKKKQIVVSALIGSYVFGYTEKQSIFLSTEVTLSNVLTDIWKMVLFETDAQITNVGVENAYIYAPFFLSPTNLFFHLDKISFGETLNLGKLDSIQDSVQ